jgi:pyrroline-5-carboxylate reductase
MDFPETVGIVGGSGQLGGAIARAVLGSGRIAPERVFISNRSGSRVGFEDWSGLNVTTRNQDLADKCDLILLSVPPAAAGDIAINAPDRLILSVMAGVTIARMGELTGARRIVRAMSSPAADIGLAYSPWCAGEAVSARDRQWTQAFFETCGLADEVPDEDQIDRFTALTGPVPGFVACFAACMVDYAERNGIDPAVADRAVRQLFKAAGVIMANSQETPAEHVSYMIDYAGTTAAGLQAMKAAPLFRSIAEGLDAAYRRAKVMG